MGDTIVCVCMLVLAFITKDHTLYIAAGMFSIAASIYERGVK